MIIYLIFLIPVLTIISSMLMYKQNGKKELLKMDLVQFIYAFVLMPVLFIWLKSFLYYLMQVEVEVQLSQLEMTLIDTGFSLVFLYIFAFVVIHSLTKSFHLKSSQDPLYDIIEHSEVFHLWITHLVVYIGMMLLITVLAAVNLFFPMQIFSSKFIFYFWNITGLLSGAIAFVMIWIADPKTGSVNFLRIMKLCYGLFFLIHVVLYFTFNPAFNIHYGIFWWSFAAFTSLVICSAFAYKSEKAHNLFSRVAEKLRHKDPSIN